jgi:predicted O-methyltransferase YrrM
MALDDPKVTEVLAEYNRRLAKEEQLIKNSVSDASIDVNALLIPVGEEVGRLMHALVVGLKAQTIVELGTSYGYSTLFLAEAARQTGGKVYSYDVAGEKQAYAHERLRRAGLADQVIFRLGDAVEFLPGQPGPVDFVLMDLWKDLYVPCLKAVAPLLGPSGTILADNMIFPPAARQDAENYRAAVRALGNMQSTLLPLGNGIDIAVKQAFIS